jgi:hypothetical protein
MAFYISQCPDDIRIEKEKFLRFFCYTTVCFTRGNTGNLGESRQRICLQGLTENEIGFLQKYRQKSCSFSMKVVIIKTYGSWPLHPVDFGKYCPHNKTSLIHRALSA